MENPTSLYDVKFTFAEPDNKLAKPQIQINNYIFTLISKSVGNDDEANSYMFGETNIIEDRNKVIFSSLDTITGNTIINSAYASVSDGGLWRLCYFINNKPDKFINYLQDTQIHIELQQFIYKHFDSLDFVKKLILLKKILKLILMMNRKQ